jgi:gluconate 2-dehydrogenase alpha chain
VVGLERGAEKSPREDFALPRIRDELKYRVRQELMLDTAIETHTLRNNPSELALPMRKWDIPPVGDGLGGAGAHWNGVTWRFLPSEFVLRSHLTERYGRNAIPADMTIQDWGITYDDIEPHYDHFERLCGTSGKAGNLRGRKIEGGNIFEGPRSNEYPNKPLIMSQAGLIFTSAAKSLGYHPFPTPASNSSAPYVNSEGLTIGQCQYCGHCEYFGCEANAKASPLVCVLPVLMEDKNFELRTHAYVKQIIFDRQSKKVRGVIYLNRRTGEEIEQPADLVVLCAYAFNNTQLLLSAGIGEPYDPSTGKGVVGKNYCHQTTSNVLMFVDDEVNPFIGTGTSPAVIDDFQGDNFDHGGLGFFGGGFIAPTVSGGRPIQVRFVPPGTPRWGSTWKQATARWYNHAFPLNCHGVSYAHRYNYLDLDPTYKDAIGRPLIRMTYNYTENDYKMSAFLTEKAVGIARAANARIVGNARPRRGNFGANNGGAAHHTGGAIMGTDPTTSAVNRYLQNWEASNLFVMGGATFPQNPGHNPTGTIGALTYWSAKAITEQYLKAPGPLVQA